MADDKKLYRVSVPSADYAEIWDEDDIKGFEDLKKEYSDATIENATPNGRYKVSVPSAEYEEEWSAEDYTGFEGLKKDYPDAVATALYDYSPYDFASAAEKAAEVQVQPSVDAVQQSEAEPSMRERRQQRRSEREKPENQVKPFVPEPFDKPFKGEEGEMQAGMQWNPGPENVNFDKPETEIKPESRKETPSAVSVDENMPLAEPEFRSNAPILQRGATQEEYDALRRHYDENEGEMTASMGRMEQMNARANELNDDIAMLAAPFKEVDKDGKETYSITDPEIYAKIQQKQTELEELSKQYEAEVGNYNERYGEMQGNQIFKAQKDREKLSNVSAQISALRKNRRDGTMPENEQAKAKAELEGTEYDASTAVPFDKRAIRQRIRDLKRQKKDIQKQLGENPAVEYMDLETVNQFESQRNEAQTIRDSYNTDVAIDPNTSVWQGLREVSRITGEMNELDAQMRSINNMYDRAEEIMTAPRKYDGEMLKFGKGVADRLKSLDFWTQGLSEIGDNVRIRNIYEKMDAGEELTPLEEQEMIAYNSYQYARMQRAFDTATLYKGGEGAADVAVLCATMAATSALGGKAISEGLKKTIMKNGKLMKALATATPKSAVGKAAVFAAKEGEEWLISDISDLFGKTMVYVALTPNAARQGSELALELDDNGHLKRTKGQAYGKAYGSEIANMYFMNSPAKLLRSFTDVARVGGKLAGTDAVEKWYRNYMKEAGKFSGTGDFNYALHSIAGPYAMLKSAAFSQITGDEEALANFFDGENLGSLILSLIPSQIKGMAQRTIARANYTSERARFEKHMQDAAADLFGAYGEAFGPNEQRSRVMYDALRSMDVKRFIDNTEEGRSATESINNAVEQLNSAKARYATARDAVDKFLNGRDPATLPEMEQEAYANLAVAMNNAAEAYRSADNAYASAVTVKTLLSMQKAIDASNIPEMSGLLEGLVKRVQSGNMTIQESASLLQKTFNLLEAVSAYQAYNGLYQGQFQDMLDTKQTEIEETVPGRKIWHTERRGELTDQFVTTVDFEGRVMFVLSEEPNEAGEYALVGEGDSMVTFVDGRILFPDGNIPTRTGETAPNSPFRTTTLREYLSRRIMLDEEIERDAAVAQAESGKFNVGDGINLPPDEPNGPGRRGVVVAANESGVRVATETGEESLSWNDVAAMRGDSMPTESEANVQQGQMEAETDKTISAEEKAANDEIQLAWKADVLPVKGLSEVHIVDGTFNPTTGEVRIGGHTADGDYIEFDTTMDVVRDAADEVAEDVEDTEEILTPKLNNAARDFNQGDRVIADGRAGEVKAAGSSGGRLMASVRFDDDGSTRFFYFEDLEHEEPAPAAKPEASSEPAAPAYETPKTPEGDVDYERMLDENPEEFYNQYAEITSRDEARAELQNRIAQLNDEYTKAKLNDKPKIAARIAAIQAVIDNHSVQEEAKPAVEAPIEAPEKPANNASTKRDMERRAAQEEADKDFHLVTEKYDASPKVEGNVSSRRIGDRKIKGRYVLVEANAPTASHDPNNGFQPSKGFPMVDGLSANSRDYTDAQTRLSTEKDAQKFNEKALHDTPVVTRDGVVISGNGRTIMSQIAAKNGTDTEYLDALNEEAANYGFTPEQIAQFKNPRVYFEVSPDEAIEYTASTFHAFNATEQKTESKSEAATRDGRILNEEKNARYLDNIVSSVNEKGSLADALRSPGTAMDIVKNMIQAGIATEKDIPRLIATKDNTGTKELGERIENALLGTAFDGEILKILVDYDYPRAGLIKEAVSRALPAITVASQLDGEFNLKSDINDAIALLYEATRFAEDSNLDLKIADIVGEFIKNSDNLFESASYTPETKLLARFIWDNHNKKGKNILEALTAYNTVVANATANNDMESMFGDEEKVEKSAIDLLKNAIFETTGKTYGTDEIATDSEDSGVGNDREPEGALGNVPERGAAPADVKAEPAQVQPAERGAEPVQGDNGEEGAAEPAGEVGAESLTPELFNSEINRIDSEISKLASRFTDDFVSLTNEKRNLVEMAFNSINDGRHKINVSTEDGLADTFESLGVPNEEASAYILRFKTNPNALAVTTMTGGHVVVDSDKVTDHEQIVTIYDHETLHQDTTPEMIQEVKDAFAGIGGDEYTIVYLRDTIRLLTGGNDYDNDSIDGLAKEFLAYGLSVAKEYPDDIDGALKAAHAKPKAIEIIKRLYEERYGKENSDVDRGMLGEICMNYNQEEREILNQILKEHPTWEVDGFRLADEVEKRYRSLQEGSK